MTAFIDTNILIALVNPTEPFHAWSLGQVNDWKARGPAIISDIVYCEFSAGMSSKGEVDSAISEFGLERLRANDTVLFRAGAAYKVYRSRQGAVKTNVLPDFLIGALAEVLDIPLITANPKDFAGYFPSVRLITPPTTKNPT